MNDFHNVLNTLQRDYSFNKQEDQDDQTVQLDEETQNYLNHFLEMALKKGATDSVVLYLELGAEINKPNSHGMTPLVLAIFYYHQTNGKHGRRTILNLLERGAAVDLVTAQCSTPLFYAASLGLEKIVHDLLAYNANVDIPHVTAGFTPLYVAAYKGYRNIISLLLKKGAKTELADSHGSTPLHIAVNQGDGESVIELLKYNAQISALNDDFCSPLDLAKQLADKSILSLLSLVKDLRIYKAERLSRGDKIKLKHYEVPLLGYTFFTKSIIKASSLLEAADALLKVVLRMEPASSLKDHLDKINQERRLLRIYSRYLNQYHHCERGHEREQSNPGLKQ